MVVVLKFIFNEKLLVMFKLMLINIFFCSSIYLSGLIAQGIAINTDESDRDTTAILDVKSQDKGILIPRLTKSQRDSILNPATGLLIFQIDQNPGFYYHNGTSWLQLYFLVIVEVNAEEYSYCISSKNYCYVYGLA